MHISLQIFEMICREHGIVLEDGEKSVTFVGTKERNIARQIAKKLDKQGVKYEVDDQDLGLILRIKLEQSDESSKPVVTLRRVKYAAFASQETSCFEAIVDVNGKPAFHASNEGHGGPDFYQPLDNSERYKRRFAGAMWVLEKWVDNQPAANYESVEGLVGEALEKILEAREVEKAKLRFAKKMVTQVLWLNHDKGGKCWSTNFRRAVTPADIAKVKQQHPNAEILNGMDIGIAFEKARSAE